MVQSAKETPNKNENDTPPEVTKTKLTRRQVFSMAAWTVGAGAVFGAATYGIRTKLLAPDISPDPRKSSLVHSYTRNCVFPEREDSFRELGMTALENPQGPPRVIEMQELEECIQGRHARYIQRKIEKHENGTFWWTLSTAALGGMFGFIAGGVRQIRKDPAFKEIEKKHSSRNAKPS